MTIAAIVRALVRTSVARPTIFTKAESRVNFICPCNPSLATWRPFSTKMGAPVVLCGATERIGAGVIENLKPEYDGV